MDSTPPTTTADDLRESHHVTPDPTRRPHGRDADHPAGSIADHVHPDPGSPCPSWTRTPCRREAHDIGPHAFVTGATGVSGRVYCADCTGLELDPIHATAAFERLASIAGQAIADVVVDAFVKGIHPAAHIAAFLDDLEDRWPQVSRLIREAIVQTATGVR